MEGLWRLPHEKSEKFACEAPKLKREVIYCILYDYLKFMSVFAYASSEGLMELIYTSLQ